MGIRKNIFDAIREVDNQQSDYIIYDGYVLNKEYLIANDFIDASLKDNDKVYPIYIPGKHPIKFDDNVFVDYSKILDSTSKFYTTSNYFELCIRDDNTIPAPASRVRVYFNKTKDKTYATGYFRVIDDNVIDNPKATEQYTSDGMFKDIAGSICALSGGGGKRGFQCNFNMMFGGVIGKLIVYKFGVLSRNLYAIAGMESSFYSGAVGDHGKSFGFFQVNTGVFKETDLKDMIQRGIKVLELDSKIGKPSWLNVDTWKKSVGFGYEGYPLGTFQSWIPDIQLVLYVGYHDLNNYIDNLINKPIYNDIVAYQKAQRFAPIYMSDYQKRTNKFYLMCKDEYATRFAELEKFAKQSKAVDEGNFEYYLHQMLNS